METIHHFFNFIMHLDYNLAALVAQYGTSMTAVLFLVIFCETGLVVTPFLPGDSLLFAAGALTAHTAGMVNIHVLFILLVTASILGNSLNYLIGKWIGPKVFHSTDSLFLNKKYLARAHGFYEQYGPKTMIIARFIPIIRTVAPFIAGLGYMGYRRFLIYNVLGAILWVGSLLYVSYLFGSLPLIRDHFSTILLGIIVISLLPVLFEVTLYVTKKYSAA